MLKDPKQVKRRFDHKKQFEKESNAEKLRLVQGLFEEWARLKPQVPSLYRLVPAVKRSEFFNTNAIQQKLASLFQCYNENNALRRFSERVDTLLNQTSSLLKTIPYVPAYEFVPKASHSTPVSCHMTMKIILKRLPALEYLGCCDSLQVPWSNLSPNLHHPIKSEQMKLDLLCDELESHQSTLRRNYGKDLRSSLRALQDLRLPQYSMPVPSAIESYRDQCKFLLQETFSIITSVMQPTSEQESFLMCAGHWPIISPKTVLQLLTHDDLSRDWRIIITAYARSFLAYQQSQRLLHLAMLGKREAFMKELDGDLLSKDHALRAPEWLLIQVSSSLAQRNCHRSICGIQIDGDFLARSIQLSVAKEMMESDHSSILQLNMGEGKSKVIVPLVSAMQADGQNLCRVVVLKPLVPHMFQNLCERLGGLVNRKILYLPFQRQLNTNAEDIGAVQQLLHHAAQERSVVIIQPEHILSFRLMTIDKLIASAPEFMKFIEIEKWLSQHTRDILDESDEILHSKYQLIYTIGHQQLFDGQPDRWILVEQAFDSIKRHLHSKLTHQSNLGGAFPDLRSVEESLLLDALHQVAEDAVMGRLPALNIRGLSDSDRDQVRQFITSQSSGVHLPEGLEGKYKVLLLLRGLIAYDILLYAMTNKRWRVDYGLALWRTSLAVPYRAKDVPTVQAEFGHPDVAIALTCISYYYCGLDITQLSRCFELLLQLDSPELEYMSWVRESRACLPISLHSIQGVNTDDHDQLREELLPVLGRSKSVIDFYLNYVVFPKECKEFPHKLSSSGWDIVEKKKNATKGFSGTNDNKHLLPTTIIQSDPVTKTQAATSAISLAYLLQPENERYECFETCTGLYLDIDCILDFLCKETTISVLLDIGAQVLDYDNREFSRHWLKGRPLAAGCLFFNEADEIVIMAQDGSEEMFDLSPLRERLSTCLIYLDDAHTRGTDIKMPLDFQAAVTLGPKVTKDRLVQGKIPLPMKTLLNLSPQ
jgi:hypothetical protein